MSFSSQSSTAWRAGIIAAATCTRQNTSAYILLPPALRSKLVVQKYYKSQISGTKALKFSGYYISIRQHTSAYISLRQHTSAYISIRQHTTEIFGLLPNKANPIIVATKEHSIWSSTAPHELLSTYRKLIITPAYVSIRQHTSAYVSIHCCARTESSSPHLGSRDIDEASVSA
jgi:hypothetical protein